MDTKILLLELPNNSGGRYRSHRIPNISTLAIGSYIKKKGYDIKIIDAHIERIGWKDMVRLIKEEKPDIVASSSQTLDIYERILLCRMIKKIDPEIMTVLGGPHVSSSPEESLRLAKDLDYAVIGEGEETFLELTRAIESGKSKREMLSVKGIAYLEEGRYVKTEPRPLISEIDNLPMPDYSLIPMPKYKIFDFPCPSHQGFSVNFSRGCGQSCNFCLEGVMWNNSWRGRSARKIVEELTILNKQYGKVNFTFHDSDFLHDRKRNIEFIEAMSHSNLKIKFSAFSRVDTLLRDRDLLSCLREEGLVSIKIGIESYEQEIISSLRKGYRVEKIKELADCLKAAKIPFLMLSFIIGNEYDTRESIFDIIHKTKKYGFVALLKISFLTPWPNTELFSQLRSRGMITTLDYRSYNLVEPVVKTRNIANEELKKLRGLLFIKWYFGMRVFTRIMFNRYTRQYLLNGFCGLIRRKFVNLFKPAALSSYSRYIEGIHREHINQRIYGFVAGDYYAKEMRAKGLRGLWFRKRQSLTLSLVRKYRKGGLVLDIGCGNCLWNNNGIPVLGIDISQDMLLYNMRNMASFSGVRANVFKGLPLKDNSVSIVVITEVLEHIPNYHFMIEEIGRVLNKNGIVIVSVPYAKLPGVWGLIFPFWCKYRWLKHRDEYYLNMCGHVEDFNIRKVRLAFNKFGLLERKIIGLMTIFAVFTKKNVSSI